MSRQPIHFHSGKQIILSFIALSGGSDAIAPLPKIILCFISRELRHVELVADTFSTSLVMRLITSPLEWVSRYLTVVSRQRFHSPKGIVIFPDMMAGHTGTEASFTPTVFRLVDATKSCFILEHQPNSFPAVDNFQLLDSTLNFLRPRLSRRWPFGGVCSGA